VRQSAATTSGLSRATAARPTSADTPEGYAQQADHDLQRPRRGRQALRREEQSVSGSKQGRADHERRHREISQAAPKERVDHTQQ
jgi:hypothetical protein